MRISVRNCGSHQIVQENSGICWRYALSLWKLHPWYFWLCLPSKVHLPKSYFVPSYQSIVLSFTWLGQDLQRAEKRVEALLGPADEVFWRIVFCESTEGPKIRTTFVILLSSSVILYTTFMDNDLSKGVEKMCLMTRVWRCNGWVTWRQRSFEMKRQRVFGSEGWKTVEVFVESLKCSWGQWSVQQPRTTAPHFKSLPWISFRCQWLWHLPPRTSCWAANLWRSSGIMIWLQVTTSSKKRVKLKVEGNSFICWQNSGIWETG